MEQECKEGTDLQKTEKVEIKLVEEKSNNAMHFEKIKENVRLLTSYRMQCYILHYIK